MLDLVEDWHNMTDQDFKTLGSPALHEYLGMTREEYYRMVELPGMMPREQSDSMNKIINAFEDFKTAESSQVDLMSLESEVFSVVNDLELRLDAALKMITTDDYTADDFDYVQVAIEERVDEQGTV